MKSFKIFQLSENRNMTSKFMGCNKVIAFNVLYVLEKRKKSKISNLSFHLRKIEKEKRCEPKASRRIEIKIIKIRAVINEIEARKQ